MTSVVGPGQALCDSYDAAMFDLDGVIYLGPDPVPGAAEAVDGLRAHGLQVGFVTNNAARPPEVVSDQLTAIGVRATVDDVVTSAQAAARMLTEALPAGSKVLCLGTQALIDEVVGAGFTAVASRLDHPDAVIQGYDPQMTWPRVTDGVHAIQAGAQWFASNLDITRPTDLGLEPGVGTQVDAVRACFPDREPMVAGKPYPALLLETKRRLGVQHPIFVGDRLDTDIRGAFNTHMDSLFVFTGAHGIRDLVEAARPERPTHIGYDARALLAPARRVTMKDSTARCGDQRVRLVAGRLELDDIPEDLSDQLDALWAALQLLWRRSDEVTQDRESLDRQALDQSTPDRQTWAQLNDLDQLH